MPAEAFGRPVAIFYFVRWLFACGRTASEQKLATLLPQAKNHLL
jgi:hypothetical protein